MFSVVLRRVSRRSLSLLPSKNSNHSFVCYFSASLHKHEITPQVPASRRVFYHRRAFTSAAKSQVDENLLRVLESEIQCAEGDHEEVTEMPRGFPFEIVDNPGEHMVTLKRQYGKEIIKVEVHMPELDGGDIEKAKDDDDEDDDTLDDEDKGLLNVSLVIEVTKEEGPCLVFCCTALQDEITIDSMTVKNPACSTERVPYNGPEFSDLDEGLQKQFHKYLEARGIKHSLTSFLHDYMINKDSREYLAWLKSMKEFIQK